MKRATTFILRAALLLPFGAAATLAPAADAQSPGAARPTQQQQSRDRQSTQSQQQHQQPARPPSYSERYGVLADHNIFVRDRSRIPRGGSGGGGGSSTQPSTRPTLKSPEEALALRGVVIEDGGLRAYVEDTNNYNMLRLSPGDNVARGKVSAIQIDAVQYEGPGGHREWIEIGQDFTGHTAAAGPSFSVGGASSTQPSGPPIDPNDPNLTLEQRMKLRRQQGK